MLLRSFLLTCLLACDPGPDPCAELCALAASVQGECLASDGLDWSALGYAGEEDYRASCETWAWEQRLLAEDAGADEDAVSQTCAARAEGLVDCAALAAIDWEDPAWEVP